MHKVKDALQGGHKDGLFSLTFSSTNYSIYDHLLTSPLQSLQSLRMMVFQENTVANPAFMTLPSQDQLLMATLCPLPTPASSVPPSVASTVTVTLAPLAPASPTKNSLDRPQPRVSLALLLTAAPSLLQTLVSFIPPSLAFMEREMLGLGVPAFPILS